MDEANIFVLAKALKIDYKRTERQGDWLNMPCPFAPFYHAKGTDNNPSFGIKVQEDGRKSVFKCLSCLRKGSLAKLAFELGNLRKQDYSETALWAEHAELDIITNKPYRDWDDIEDEKDKAIKVHIPDPSQRLSFPLALGVPYLRTRRVMYDGVVKLDLRYDDWQQRILFPVYDEERRFRGFSGRSTMPDKMLSRKNPKARDYYGLNKRFLFLNHRNYPFKAEGIYDRQIIVEGLFAYAAMYMDGFVNTNAALGTGVSDEKVDILIARNKPVYLFFDNDKAGYDAVFGNINEQTGERLIFSGLAHKLYTHIPVWICPYPEGTEDLDPHDLTRKQRIWAIKNATLYTEKEYGPDEVPW